MASQRENGFSPSQPRSAPESAVGQPESHLRRLINAVGCTVFHQHQFVLLGQPSEWSVHVGCSRCERQWGISHASGQRQMLRWSAVSGFYRALGYPPKSSEAA